MSEENKQLSGVMLELYKDSLQPSVRIWGKYLGDLASRRVRALRKNLLKAADKLQQENPENIISPKFDVAMPILEKMRYTEEEALADAYAELLKNSCLKDRQAKVLPAYSQILSSITPDEVKILDFVYREKNTYKTPVREVMKFASEEEIKRILVNRNVSDDTLIHYPIAGIPFLEVRSNLKGRECGETLAKYFTDIDRKVDLSSSESVEVYIDNLRSLGILDAEVFSFIPVAIYSELESEAARQYETMIERENRVMRLVNGSIELTPLAKSFLAMCTSNRHNEETNAPPA